jgi:RHS repeat-associated protein
MKNVEMRNCVEVPSDVKSGGRFLFWATTRVAPTKYRRAKKTLHATSIQRNSSHKSFSLLGRGYTGHEHLLEHGIINMNGRIYDPVTAQFMQADNYVSSPEDYISYNRYAYCLYNPFKYTDPSGETVTYGYVNGIPALICDDEFVWGHYYNFKYDASYESPQGLWIRKIEESTISVKGGGGGGVGSNTGAPSQETPTLKEILLTSKRKEAEKFKERTEKIEEAKKANKANEYVAPWLIGGSIIEAAKAIGVAITSTGFIAAGLITALAVIPSSERIPDNVYQATNTNQLNNEIRKQNIDMPNPRIPNPGDKNKEFREILKSALEKVGKKWTPKLERKFHDYVGFDKDMATKNVPKQLLKQLAKEFAEGLK